MASVIDTSDEWIRTAASAKRVSHVPVSDRPAWQAIARWTEFGEIDLVIVAVPRHRHTEHRRVCENWAPRGSF
jgi:hypothetical protein